MPFGGVRISCDGNRCSGSDRGVSLARGPAFDDVDGIAACVLTPQEALARRGEIEGGFGRCYTGGNVERTASACGEANGKKEADAMAIVPMKQGLANEFPKQCSGGG